MIPRSHNKKLIGSSFIFMLVILTLFTAIIPSGTEAVKIVTSSTDVDCIDIAPLDDENFVMVYHDKTNSSFSFVVYDVNGTIIHTETGFAKLVGTNHMPQGISVSAFNSTTFVIGYVNLTSQYSSFMIFNTSGDLLVGPINVDTTVSNEYSAISVSCFDPSKFVIAWEDTASFDIVFAIYSSNGTQLVAPTIVDPDSSTAFCMSVSVSCLNSTRFAIGWFDRVDDDASYAIYDVQGNEIVSPRDADTDVGDLCLSVSIAALNGSAFVFAWNDQTDKDVTFCVINSVGTITTAPTDVEIDTDIAHVAISAIDDDKFTIVWYDKTDSANRFSTYYADGTAICADVAIYDNTQYLYNNKIFSVCGREAATGIGFLNSNFIIAYGESATVSKWSAYTPLGYNWDTSYEYPYSTTVPDLIYTDTDRYIISPVVAKADNGDLIILFRNSTSHNINSGTLDQLRSTDDGVTWTYEGVANNDLADMGPGTLVNYNGRLITVCCSGTPHTSIVITSDDNGTTWTNQGTLNDLTNGEPSNTVLYVIQQYEIVNGTLYGMGYYIDGSLDMFAFVVSSTDGINYDFLSTIGNGIESNEGSLIYLGNSTFLSIIRSSDDVTTFKATSTDMGETWAVVDYSAPLGGHYWHAPKLDWIDNNTIILVGRNQDTLSLNYAISDDNGTTWSNSQLIQTYRSSASWNGGYADLEPNARSDGSMLVVYYSNALPSNINYPDVWMSWIEGASYYDVDDISGEPEPSTVISFTSTPVTTAINGTEYSYDANVNVSGAVFSLVAGPSWISINATTGVISGTPNVTGSATITIRATLNGTTAVQTYTLTVSETPVGMNMVNIFMPALIMLLMLGVVLKLIRRSTEG